MKLGFNLMLKEGCLEGSEHRTCCKWVTLSLCRTQCFRVGTYRSSPAAWLSVCGSEMRHERVCVRVCVCCILDRKTMCSIISFSCSLGSDGGGCSRKQKMSEHADRRYYQAQSLTGPRRECRTTAILQDVFLRITMCHWMNCSCC